MGKKVTNECIQRELGEINATLRELSVDIKDIAPRVKSLELFRSYIKGGAAVLSGIGLFVFSAFKGVFGHF